MQYRTFVIAEVLRVWCEKHGSRNWKRGMVDLIDTQTGLGVQPLAGTIRYSGAHPLR